MKEVLAEKLNMSLRHLEILLEGSEIIKYKKNSQLMLNNAVSHQLGYVISGALRTYTITKEGEEFSFLLQVDGDFFGDYESFLTGKESDWILKTTTVTEVLIFDKEYLHTLMEQDPYWIKFYKQIADMCFLDAKRRIEELLFYTYEERYLNLLKCSPKIVQLIPQKFIASYLGITTQSLSRIKSRVFLT